MFQDVGWIVKNKLTVVAAALMVVDENLDIVWAGR
jgi:hypothetical protein